MAIINFEKIGDVGNINTLKEVLIALMSKLDGAKYKTELIKLCFILDYKYCQEFKKSDGPTTVKYVKYNYGPYSASFIEAFNILKEEGIISEVGLQFGEGLELIKNIEVHISDDIQEMIKKVVAEYGNRSLREMKDFIYNLEEFKKTEFGSPIVLFN